MWLGLVFLYVDGYLGVVELFAQIFLTAYIVGILVTPVWCKIAIKVGKKITMSLAFILLIISFIYTGMLNPGEADLGDLLVLKITNTLGASGILAIAPAMLSKIIDYSSWRFRSDNTAMYFSLYAFLSKMSIAIGAGFGLAIAGWYGFDAAATSHSEESVWGLTVAMTWIPLFFSCIALIFVALNPISARSHAIVRRRLDSRISGVK